MTKSTTYYRSHQMNYHRVLVIGWFANSYKHQRPTNRRPRRLQIPSYTTTNSNDYSTTTSTEHKQYRITILWAKQTQLFVYNERTFEKHNVPET